ncbi:MAG: oligosaccharide flippase family protein, partial [Clostridia bacterium]|nr:oligosaccharide flippase family protein [Clostridia bacterium]
MNVIKKAYQKYNSFPVPVKASFFFVFCGVFKDVVDVISTPVFTRMLTTEEYGLFSVYNSWYQIIRIVITLSIFSDSFNVGMSRYGEKKERFASSQQGLITTLFLIWASVIFVFRDALSDLTGLETSLIILMLAQVLFSSAFYVWFQKNRYLYSYRILTAVTLVYTVLQPLLGIILIKINNSASYGFGNGDIRIYAGVGVQILFGAVFFVIQFIKNRTYFDKEYWSFSIKINLPLLPHYLSQILLNQSDKLMIDCFQGKSFTAVYSVAHAAAFVLQAVTNNLNATFIPWFYGKLKRRDYSGVRRGVTLLLLFSGALVIALVLVAPEAMKILAGADYHEGIWIIPPLAVSVYLMFFYMLFSDLELFFGKSHYIMVSSLTGAASNIVLNYIFIQKFGYLAAGYTTVAGYLLMCAGHAAFAKLTCKKEGVPFGMIYDAKALISITASLFVLCAGAMMLYNYPV